MTKSRAAEKQRFYHIDFMRFVFSVIIVVYHILNANIMSYVTDPVYTQLAKQLNYSSNIVVCFFILAGVFQYRSFRADPEQSVFQYIVNRVVRLWPVLFFAILAEAVLIGKFDWSGTLINAMFLQCSGLSLDYRSILWYVSAFFFASVFLYAVLRSFSLRKAGFIISLLAYFSCTFLINYFDGRIGGRETVLYVLNVGVVRGVAFMGTGILLSMIYEKLSAMFTLAPLSTVSRRILFVLKAATELLAIVFMYKYFICSQSPKNHIVLVLVFSLFLLCLISEKDPLGLILNHKIFGFFGKYAYSIYVMQGISFLILKKTLWQSASLLANPWVALAVSTAFSVAVGVGVYHLIEKPCGDLFRKWYKKFRTASAEEE